MRNTALLSMLALFALPFAARAQDCGCDHVLELDVTSADGEALGVEPGDVVCVAAGERPFLRLSRFVGTAEAPIVVVNCGGVAHIRNQDRAYALVVEGESRHVHVTGTGEEGVTWGFRVSAPDTEPYGGVGVWIQGRSSDVEVDHVEVYETGFAGVMAKTDPGCADRAAWPDYVMRNIRLHHLWVHDTGGEGMYIGSTQAMGYARECDGESVTIPAHFIEGLEIHHVLIEDTGWDGAQVGFARSGCRVHDNVIRRVGGAGELYQQQGLQIGAYTSCEVRRNILSDGPANGIIVLDAA
ncbi:MAG TPA: right-handed parallel beta-helix repeat-containing protein, partial [Sandaracinaceae bacterium]